MKKKIILLSFCFTFCFFVGRKTDEQPHPLLNAKIEYLLNEGYKKNAAEHIAKVELKLIPVDEFYVALMED